IFIISFFILLVPVFHLSVASSFLDIIISGLLMGVGGATFSIGVTSLPKYYPKEKHGFINGVYAVGNAGTAISTFFAPIVAGKIGWESTVRIYLIILLLFIVLNIFMGDRKEKKVRVSMFEQIKSVYKNQTLWFLSLFYFVTFGAFVAFTVYLPNFLVSNFGLDPVDAGLRTAGFIVFATLLRPHGGLLADKFNPYIILMIIFFWTGNSGVVLSFSPTISIYTISTVSIASFVGIVSGTLYKLVPLNISTQADSVNGIVPVMGGLVGFFPAIILTAVFNTTGHHAIGFMALADPALVSFVF